ncbi:MAG TPA: DUF3866 family protein [Coriobacteriia bacterium]
MRLVWADVSGIAESRDGLQRLGVSLDDGSEASAVCYPALTGACASGDRVLLNTTAVDLSLGTGGAHFVVARTPGGGGAPRGVALDDDSGGHVMKLRYTPLQRDVLAAEAPESVHHAALQYADDAGGMPVVCCPLHSHLPLVAAGVLESAPSARIAYVMTDAAALPIALSDLVPACVDAGLVEVTVTCGQAFGGDVEAVNLHSGLLVARHVCGVDAAIVAIGPGVVGTGTAFGHGGVAQGEAVNAAAAVGAAPVAGLRLSFADTRDRHRGVSHHTLTALGRVALARAAVAVPALPAGQAAAVDDALASAGVWERHSRVDVADRPLPDLRGVPARSMGRGPSNDPAFFAAAAAAGRVAAGMIPVGEG